MQIKYWINATDQMLIVDAPEDRKQDKVRISMLLAEAYTTWSNPEEDYDDEDIIEEIYDSECVEFITGEANKSLGYKLEYTTKDNENERDADYILDVM